MSDADIITAKLREIRTRQFLILLLRCSSLALIVYVFWLVLCSLTIFPFPRPTALFQLLACAVLASTVVVISLFKIPSLKDAAKLADRVLGLEQRLETTWECIPPREEIETLLLSDTRQRIMAIRPSAVVPIQFGRTTRRLLLICLLATTALGIVKVLEDWNRAYLPRTNHAPQTVSNSSAQSKNAQKESIAKKRANSSGRAQASTDYQPNTESGRSSLPDSSNRALDSVPEQTQLQPAQSPPATSMPDSGNAGRQRRLSAASAASEPGIKQGSGKEANSDQTGRMVSVPQDKSYSRGGEASADLVFRPNAGARSVRKSSGEGGQYAGTAALSKAAANAGMVLGGQPGGAMNTSALNRNDVTLSGEYSRGNPAFGFAVEQALQKEKIPPGFKKYIADYFNAIHP